MKNITLFNFIFRRFPGEINPLPSYLPYGCLCIMAVLRKAGYDVDFRDYQFNDYSDPTKIENIRDFLDDSAPVISISCLSRELPYCVLLSYELKRKYPEKKIILGGNGPSGVGENLISAFPFIDFVVIGEGEETIVELMEAIENKREVSSVKGIVFRKDGTVTVTPGRERIKELDNLPLPAYDLVDMNKYDEIYLSCSRGCPYRCTFCSQASFWDKQMISKGTEKIFEELDIIAQYKPDCTVSISDNIFCHKKEDLQNFYDEYKKRNYNFKINMSRRVDNVDSDILGIIRDMKCQAMLYGIESASRDVLKKIKKSFSVDVKDLILKTANRIEVFASFIFNYPFETIHDFFDTMNFIYDILHIPTAHHLVFHLHYLAPIAGTEIIEEYRDKLIYKEFANVLTTGRAMENYDYWRYYDTNKTLVMPPLAEVKTHSTEIRNMVFEYKDIFPSYYIYSSPDMETKEKFLKCLYKAHYTNIRDYFFHHNNYKIFIGSKKFYIVSHNPNIKDNALYITLDEGNLNDVRKLIKENSNKKIFIDNELNLHMSREFIEKVHSLFESILEEKIDYTLIKSLPFSLKIDGASTTDNCKKCLSMFHVEDDRVVYCGGRRGKYFPLYKSREDIYEDFLKVRAGEPGNNNCCLYR